MTLGFQTFSIASARADDAEALIDLMVMSSHLGLVTAWQAECAAGEEWRDVARRGVADRTGELGFGNILVARLDAPGGMQRGAITGMAVLNAAAGPFMLAVANPEEAQRALVRLLNRAVPALMIREIAVLPEMRGRGVARALVDTAELVARQKGLPRLSLTVNEANHAARQVYDRLGFSLLETGPAFPHPHWPTSAATLLMTRDL
jgi:GNAT superfamily N-acetyltransferase